MTERLTPNRASISRGHQTLLLVAAATTALLIVLGGMVCIADASAACPDWPWCYGQIVPPLEIKAILEYTHRVVAALTTLLIVIAALVGWRQTRHLPWVSRPPLMAIAFVLAVIVFGALVVLRGLPPWAAALDLGSALMVLALMVTAATAAHAPVPRTGHAARFSWHTPLGRMSLIALGAVYAVLVSAVLVAEPGSAVRCLSWPMYTAPGAGHVARSALAGIASLLVLGTVTATWRSPGRRPVLDRSATVVALLLVLATVLALLRPLIPGDLAAGAGAAMSIFSAVAATAFWVAMVVLALLSGLLPSNQTKG